MDPKLFEVQEAGGQEWRRADRVMERGFWEAAAEQIGDQLAEDYAGGVVKHGENVYRWRWTEAATARRRAEARARLAAEVKEKRAAAAAWLASEDGAALAAAAGFRRMGPREVLEQLAGAKAG